VKLLTAPNMSGKSTLMRASLTMALLANCGLFVPARKAVVPRYDNFFLRTTCHDIPRDRKSAFALEMVIQINNRQVQLSDLLVT
jgi:DNA mismatch repair ATPase MutS